MMSFVVRVGRKRAICIGCSSASLLRARSLHCLDNARPNDFVMQSIQHGLGPSFLSCFAGPTCGFYNCWNTHLVNTTLLDLILDLQEESAASTL